MDELLMACGDVATLKKLLSQLPKQRFKPIATKKGQSTAQKVANRHLAGAVIHAQLADGSGLELAGQLKAHRPNLPVLLLADDPPSDGPFDRALRYPVPGPVFRNALSIMGGDSSQGVDKERWRAFFNEVNQRLKAADEQSYYAILGVQDGAPHHRLVTAFDRLSMRYHPDRYTQHRDKDWGKKLHDRVNHLYKLLTHAYGVVSDRRLRKLYDEALSKGELRLDPEKATAAEQGPRSLDEFATTDKGRRFLSMAQAAIAKGDTGGAIQNLQFALSLEPDNDAIQRKLDELQHH